MWDEITYPYQNVIGAAVDVWELTISLNLIYVSKSAQISTYAEGVEIARGDVSHELLALWQFLCFAMVMFHFKLEYLEITLSNY